MAKPKKWTEVYPQGTVEGDDEAKFFRSLARNPKFAYRSTPQIMSDTGLTRQRVEEIIDKYATMKPPLIVPHSSNADHWGYWERCEEGDDECEKSLCQTDQENRIDRQNAPIIPDLVINIPDFAVTNCEIPPAEIQLPPIVMSTPFLESKEKVYEIPLTYQGRPIEGPNLTQTSGHQLPMMFGDWKFENLDIETTEIKISWEKCMIPFDFTASFYIPPPAIGQWEVNGKKTNQ